jgi:hypothetical protein
MMVPVLIPAHWVTASTEAPFPSWPNNTVASCVLNRPSEVKEFFYKGNPNSLDEQLFSQDLVRGNPK